MRARFDRKLEEARVRHGDYASEPGDLYGAFELQGPCGSKLTLLSSGDPHTLGAWEHVSVSTPKRIPNWLEMSFAKWLFWDDEECVLQFHPPRSCYVNCHPYCLHLWRPTDNHVRLPPMILVGASGDVEPVRNVG